MTTTALIWVFFSAIIPTDGGRVQSVWAGPDLEFTRVRTADNYKAKSARRLGHVFTCPVPAGGRRLLTDKSPRRLRLRAPERTACSPVSGFLVYSAVKKPFLTGPVGMIPLFYFHNT